MTNYTDKQEGSNITTGFFCYACLVDKPAIEVSPDPRYCQGCYDFLTKEAGCFNNSTKDLGDMLMVGDLATSANMEKDDTLKLTLRCQIKAD